MSKITGHEKLEINAKLLILANGWKLTAFDTLKKNFVVQLYIKVMRKGQQRNSWSNGWQSGTYYQVFF
jgi:hypothetical protein